MEGYKIVYVEPTQQEKPKKIEKGYYFPWHKDWFPEGSDANVALAAGRQVSIDENGRITGVSDFPYGPTEYDLFGNKIAGIYYPKDANAFPTTSPAAVALRGGKIIEVLKDGYLCRTLDPVTGDCTSFYRDGTKETKKLKYVVTFENGRWEKVWSGFWKTDTTSADIKPEDVDISIKYAQDQIKQDKKLLKMLSTILKELGRAKDMDDFYQNSVYAGYEEPPWGEANLETKEDFLKWVSYERTRLDKRVRNLQRGLSALKDSKKKTMKLKKYKAPRY
jgi:hypothetical protein